MDVRLVSELQPGNVVLFEDLERMDVILDVQVFHSDVTVTSLLHGTQYFYGTNRLSLVEVHNHVTHLEEMIAPWIPPLNVKAGSEGA